MDMTDHPEFDTVSFTKPMTAPTPEEVKAWLDKATPGPWIYRAYEHDYWGVVRSAVMAEKMDDGTYYPIIASASLAEVSEADKQAARKSIFEDKVYVDPVEGTARLIAAAPTLATAYLSLHEQLAEARERIAELEALDTRWQENVLAVMLHLSERSRTMVDGDFKSGFQSAAEELGAWFDEQGGLDMTFQEFFHRVNDVRVHVLEEELARARALLSKDRPND